MVNNIKVSAENLGNVPLMLMRMINEMERTAEFQGSVHDYAEMLNELALLIEVLRKRIIFLEGKLAELKSLAHCCGSKCNKDIWDSV